MNGLAPLPSGGALRIVYAGTPEIAVGPLRALHGAGFDIACVLTGVDKRRGRGNATTPSPVKTAALELGLEVVHDVDDLVRFTGDSTIGVVVAYGALIPHDVLASIPMVNAHYSLLPRWRGAAPVERAILEGDSMTGVCVMRVVDELDAGEIYGRQETPIGPRETADELRARLDSIAQELLIDSLRTCAWRGEPQTGEVVYARKISAHDRLIRCDDAQVESRRVRIGGAYVVVGGRRLRIRVAQPVDSSADPRSFSVVDGRVVLGCRRGSLLCDEVQPEGRSAMSALDWWRGLHSPDTLVVDDD